MAQILFDGPASAAERNLLAQLEGPYAGTARMVTVPVGTGGAASVDWTSRHPVVVAVLRRDLGEETVRVTATVDPGGAGEEELAPATFAPWTERGAALPLLAPDTAAEPSVPPFDLAVAAELATGDGAFAPVGDAELGELVELAVLEGNLGRLLCLLTQEKHRLRRAAREVQAYRTTAHARRDALDRLGADVGVARFDDELVYDSAKGEVYARRLPPPAVEPDAAYAHRLRPYRRFMLPTPGALTGLLNGPGDPGDPNAGLFNDLAGGARFKLVETDDQFAVAVHLLAVGGAQHRTNLLLQLRRDRLVLPAATPANDATHHGRHLPASRIAAVDALRARLRQSFTFADTHAVAPPLAAALDRAGRVCRAVGSSSVWVVNRAQDDAGGSRYELGLGVELKAPTVTQVNALRNRVLDPNRTPSDDATAEALIAAINAAGVPDSTADPDMAWLWRACGLQTVHRASSGGLFLSHLPTRGLVISGPSVGAPGAAVQLEARFHAPGDPGSNALLLSGLAAAADAWAEIGEAPWTGMTDAQAKARWATVPARPASQPVQQALAAAGLPVVTDPAPVVAALNQLPDELVETIQLDAALSAALVAGQPQAVERLAHLAELLRANNLAAVLPLVDNTNQVLLVVSVIGLPKAGLNLSGRRATGFRWYTVGLGGATGDIKAIGSRTVVRGRQQGVLAVVALSYVRTGATDPYEFRVELPDGVALTLPQYERLMNALTRACPIGVEINTFRLRREHVDLDGDGNAEPLLPAVARTFRTYRRRKLRGVYD